MGSGISKGGADGALLQDTKAHEKFINCMSISEDHSFVVTGSDDHTAKIWGRVKDKAFEDLGTLRGHESAIYSVTVSEIYVFTGSADRTIKQWDLVTTDCMFTYVGHEGRINRLLCTGSALYSTSHDTTAREWVVKNEGDTADDPTRHVFQGHTSIVSPMVCIMGDKGSGDKLVTGSFDSTVRVWSSLSGDCLHVLKGHTKAVASMNVDPMGAILYTAGADEAIIAWDIARGRIMKKVDNAHKGPILHLIVVNKLAYTCSSDNTAKCWVREGLQNTRTYKEHTDSVVTAKFHKGILYTGCNDGHVRAFDAKSGALKRRFEGHTSSVTCLVVAAFEGKSWLVSGSFDCTIKVWDVTELSDDYPAERSPTPEYDSLQDDHLDDLYKRLDEYMPRSPTSDTESVEALQS